MALSAKRGDLLSELKPFVHCLSSDELPHFCSQCLDNDEDADLLRCSGCKVLRYCNGACQKEDWKFHRIECKCLQQVASLEPPIPYEVVRLIVRILIRRKKGETKEKCDSLGIRSFDELMSHSEEIKNDATRSVMFYKLCSSLAIFTKGILNLPNQKELLDIFGKICINSFGLNVKGRSAGVAIYLSSSSLDHSCDPDACAIVNGIVQQVRAIKNFTYDEYSDIKVSYVNLLAPSYERRRELRKQYYFICQCLRCTEPSLDRLMTSTKCPTDGCKSPIFELAEGTFAPCNDCGMKDFPDDYSERKETSIADCVDTVTNCENYADRQLDPAMVYNLISTTMKSATKILHQYNVYLVRLMDAAFFVCTRQMKLDEALKYGRAKIDPLNKLLPASHPIRCTHFMEVGKLELYLGYFQDALKTFESVNETLYLVYGENHPTSLKMKEMIAQCKLEIAARTQSQS